MEEDILHKPSQNVSFILSFPFFIRLFFSIALCLRRCASDHLIIVSFAELSSVHVSKLESRSGLWGFQYLLSGCLSRKIVCPYTFYSFTSSVPILKKFFLKV